MKTIGVRELKENTSEVMRRVREEHDSFLVTYHGRAIARIIPTQAPAGTTTPEQWLDAWAELGKEVSAVWPEDVSAVDGVREQRRNLS